MRKFRRDALAIGALALMLVVPPAHAASVGVEFGLGVHNFALDDVNDELTLFNDVIGTNFGEIHTATGLPLALRVWPNEQVLLRFGIEPILIESNSSSTSDASYETGPVAVTATATWFFARPDDWRFGAGAGLGSYQIVGKIKGPGGHGDLSGTAFGAHLQGEIEWAFTKRWALCGQGGYRFAKVTDTKLEDSSADPRLETDFTGPFMHIGFAYDWR